jgi:hypothetical protein
MNISNYLTILLIVFFGGAIENPMNGELGDIENKIEIRAAYDLPPMVSTNTKITIEKRKNTIVCMELIYEIRKEWDKQYKKDKQIRCRIDNSQEYDALWDLLLEEDVFELRELKIGNTKDALLYSDLPSFTAPTIFDGKKEHEYSCLDIEKIVGDKRYLNVLRLLKNFIEKYHCDQAVPDWLTRPLREKYNKKE